MYNPLPKKLSEIRTHLGHIPHLAQAADKYEKQQTLDTATNLLAVYFNQHKQGDIQNLRIMTSAFADKRATLNIINSLSEKQLEEIAGRSYPHPIGFDKFVLYQDPSGFKFRLHVYWRSPQEIANERVHLHRFEMASSPITGEITNHLYALTKMEGAATEEQEGDQIQVEAYTGYERDKKGILHKRHLGSATLVRKNITTFVPGQTYAQCLEDPHYIETNAETGTFNRDVCSTIYIHGPGLEDQFGRKIPILFEDEKLANDDSIISTIPNTTVKALKKSLEKYKALLSESIQFYDWLYDPKYGKNLSVGLVAGYFLAEQFQTKNVIQMWNEHKPACETVLKEKQTLLEEILRKQKMIEEYPERDQRYLQQLINKAHDHPKGIKDWIHQSGNLAHEFNRYLGAMIGDYARNEDIRVLKPIWLMETENVVSGAHYGHISAMLEATKNVGNVLHAEFGKHHTVKTNSEGVHIGLDEKTEKMMLMILDEHFPGKIFHGEKITRNGKNGVWISDGLDATRNYAKGNKDFATSLAHQNRKQTTDAVVYLPAHNETFWAEKNQGSFFINHEGIETKLHIPDVSLEHALIELSGKGLGKNETKMFEWIRSVGAIPRSLGCASYALAKVSGKGNDAAIITAEEYDVAAGLLIAEEAGAKIGKILFRRAGRDFTVYLASAPSLYEPIYNKLEELVC